MEPLAATPARLSRLADRLARNDAQARVLREDRFAGPLGAGPAPSTLTVGGKPVEIPDGALITVRTSRDGKAGIEVSSDSVPEPPGMWLRVDCLAVSQVNEVLRELVEM